MGGIACWLGPSRGEKEGARHGVDFVFGVARRLRIGIANWDRELDRAMDGISTGILVLSRFLGREKRKVIY